MKPRRIHQRQRTYPNPRPQNARWSFITLILPLTTKSNVRTLLARYQARLRNATLEERNGILAYLDNELHIIEDARREVLEHPSNYTGSDGAQPLPGEQDDVECFRWIARGGLLSHLDFIDLILSYWPAHSDETKLRILNWVKVLRARIDQAKDNLEYDCRPKDYSSNDVLLFHPHQILCQWLLHQATRYLTNDQINSIRLASMDSSRRTPLRAAIQRCGQAMRRASTLAVRSDHFDGIPSVYNCDYTNWLVGATVPHMQLHEALGWFCCLIRDYRDLIVHPKSKPAYNMQCYQTTPDDPTTRPAINSWLRQFRSPNALHGAQFGANFGKAKKRCHKCCELYHTFQAMILGWFYLDGKRWRWWSCAEDAVCELLTRIKTPLEILLKSRKPPYKA